ncbi:MAG: nicotinamide-nucleotide amidohydrolase family protein [Pseudomonadota bacterium]
MNKTLLSLSRQCGELLLQQRCKVSTAESCTGGWIAQCITAVAGSSDWFETGFVTYSNQAKQQLLGVPVECFEGSNVPGAVSEETVLAMARGALQVAGAQYAVATSGVAGPGGGTPGKPVGTVWIGWAWREGDTVKSLARVQRFTGDREAVRKQSVQAALEGLLALLQARNVAASGY